MKFLWLKVVLSTVFVGACALACSDSSVTANDKEACTGSACSCSASCTKRCDADNKGGCGFTCDGAGQTCSFSCPGGGCSVSCASNTTCAVDCPKGNCTISGADGASIDVKCGNQGNCVTTCGGTRKCVVDGRDVTAGGGGGGGGEVDAGGFDFDF